MCYNTFYNIIYSEHSFFLKRVEHSTVIRALKVRKITFKQSEIINNNGRWRLFVFSDDVECPPACAFKITFILFLLILLFSYFNDELAFK